MFQGAAELDTPRYVETYSCDNAENHGELVACLRCGELVRFGGEHFQCVIEGLLGSGRWVCDVRI